MPLSTLTQPKLLEELIRRVDFSNPKTSAADVYADLIPSPNVFNEAVQAEVDRRTETAEANA